MSTTPPRYSAPDRSRQRIRLIAALGLLASTAIAIGGAGHVLTSEGSLARGSSSGEQDFEPSDLRHSTASHPAEPIVERASRDSLSPLLIEVERAERAVSSARAALRRARIIGSVDAEQLDWLERRLDVLGSPALPQVPTLAQEDAQAAGLSDRGGPREL